MAQFAKTIGGATGGLPLDGLRVGVFVMCETGPGGPVALACFATARVMEAFSHFFSSLLRNYRCCFEERKIVRDRVGDSEATGIPEVEIKFNQQLFVSEHSLGTQVYVNYLFGSLTLSTAIS